MYLIAGATGYVGGLLADELSARGRDVRCHGAYPGQGEGALRRPLRGRPRATCSSPDTLGPALEGDRARLLPRPLDGPRRRRRLRRARPPRRRATSPRPRSEAGVGRIVYLGGLGEGQSDHLRSRQETAEGLASTGIPLTYFRAAIVIGSGSESLMTIAYLVKRLPAMVTPSWTSTRTQPIAAADVVAYLAAAPDVPESTGREIEIGGPEVTTYGGLLDLAAEALGRAPAPADRRAAALAEPELALDRAGHPGRHRRRATAGRGPDDRDRRRGPAPGWSSSTSSRRRCEQAMEEAVPGALKCVADDG